MLTSANKIDDILQLGSLSGSLRLLLQDVLRFRFRTGNGRKRLPVALFLLASALGRFSVSLFGVGYSVNDIPTVEVTPEIRASVWPDVTNDTSNPIDAVFAPLFETDSFSSEVPSEQS